MFYRKGLNSKLSELLSDHFTALVLVLNVAMAKGRGRQLDLVGMCLARELREFGGHSSSFGGARDFPPAQCCCSQAVVQYNVSNSTICCALFRYDPGAQTETHNICFDFISNYITNQINS
jgi:hypothetical protein